MSSTELAVMPSREIVKELGERVKRFLPNGKQMSSEQALSFANDALSLGLNPFAGEIWFVPRMGTVTGIAGYRKIARKQSAFHAETRMMTGPERQEHDIADGSIGAICELYRHDILGSAAMVNKAAGSEIIPIKPVIGTAVWRKGENVPKARSPLWVAKKRAEADAIRKAFDISIRFEDDVAGNGRGFPSATLPDWAVAEPDTNGNDPDQTLAEGRRLLRGDDEVDIVTGEVVDGPDWDDLPGEDDTQAEISMDDKVARRKAAAAYILDSGTAMGTLDDQELGTLLEKINGLKKPNQKMLKVKGNAEELLGEMAEMQAASAEWAVDHDSATQEAML